MFLVGFSIPDNGKTAEDIMEYMHPLMNLVFYWLEKVKRFRLSKEVENTSYIFFQNSKFVYFYICPHLNVFIYTYRESGNLLQFPEQNFLKLYVCLKNFYLLLTLY